MKRFFIIFLSSASYSGFISILELEMVVIETQKQKKQFT